MNKLEENSRAIWKSPLTEFELIRNGTHCIFHDILVRTHSGYNKMRRNEKEEYIERVKKSMDIYNFKTNFKKNLLKFYDDDDDDKDGDELITKELISLDDWNEFFIDCKDENSTRNKLINHIVSIPEINQLSDKEAEVLSMKIIKIFSKMWDCKPLSYIDKVNNLASRVERSLYFFDAITKLPYENPDKNYRGVKFEKSLVLLNWQNKHFEIVGVVSSKKRYYYDFDDNHVLITQIQQYLEGNLFTKKFNYDRTLRSPPNVKKYNTAEERPQRSPGYKFNVVDEIKHTKRTYNSDDSGDDSDENFVKFVKEDEEEIDGVDPSIREISPSKKLERDWFSDERKEYEKEEKVNEEKEEEKKEYYRDEFYEEEECKYDDITTPIETYRFNDIDKYS